ncbi:hypothetical protein Catovirus_1_209 [Catovirus CTV1]|uniref:Uncharacterized protein n=1 Tax=Catovirus CTV1 TaxID=1977631 RepID=A0A1V0S8X5_9VIRU|nr:hypothetical protein Catovirus_1_209 [Catovirus CTV1]
MGNGQYNQNSMSNNENNNQTHSTSKEENCANFIMPEKKLNEEDNCASINKNNDQEDHCEKMSSMYDAEFSSELDKMDKEDKDNFYDGDNIIDQLKEKLNDNKSFTFVFKHKYMNEICNYINKERPPYSITYQTTWWFNYKDHHRTSIRFDKSNIFSESIWK